MLIMFASRNVVVHPGVDPKGLCVDIWYDREAPTLNTSLICFVRGTLTRPEWPTKVPAPKCVTRGCPTGGKFARYRLIAPIASVDGNRFTTTWEYNWQHCGEVLHRNIQLILKHRGCWVAKVEVGDCEMLHVELPDYDPDWPPPRQPSIWTRLIQD